MSCEDFKKQFFNSNLVDKKMRELEFKEGDLVFLKLRPHRQSSLLTKINQKLVAKYFGPFHVLRLIGVVANELKLPTELKIHPVVHRCISSLQESHKVLVQWDKKPKEEATWMSYEDFKKQFFNSNLVDKVHYVAKWKGITFMTSRQGLGVGGGTPYGFNVGQSERGSVLKGLDLGVQGMRVGGQRLLVVPPELAYGSKGVQEIPPNATIESPFGTPAKLIEG
ncbi:hypothetical protein V2J09_004464 [Rumex salicifolius]